MRRVAAAALYRRIVVRLGEAAGARGCRPATPLCGRAGRELLGGRPLRAAHSVAVYGRTTAAANDTAEVFALRGAAKAPALGDGFVAVLGDELAHWPPGSPLRGSPRTACLAGTPLGARGQPGVGTATAVLLHLVARRLLGRAAGVLAGIPFALLAGPVLFAAPVPVGAAVVFLQVGPGRSRPSSRRAAGAPVALGVIVGLAGGALSPGGRGCGCWRPRLALVRRSGAAVMLRRARAGGGRGGGDVLAGRFATRWSHGLFAPGRVQRQRDAWSGRDPKADGAPSTRRRSCWRAYRGAAVAAGAGGGSRRRAAAPRGARTARVSTTRPGLRADPAEGGCAEQRHVRTVRPLAQRRGGAGSPAGRAGPCTASSRT